MTVESFTGQRQNTRGSNEVVKLIEVPDIDLKTVGRNNLIIGAVANTYVTGIVSINTGADSITVQPTIRIGKAPNYNEFMDSTVLDSELQGVGDYQSFVNRRGATMFSGGDDVVLDVVVGSTATTHIVTVEVWGYILAP